MIRVRNLVTVALSAVLFFCCAGAQAQALKKLVLFGQPSVNMAISKSRVLMSSTVCSRQAPQRSRPFVPVKVTS